MSTVTASMLYDLVQCPHRLTMEIFGDPSQKDPESPFIELLWEKGTSFEQEVIEQLEVPYLDLRPYPNEERERLTMEAMGRGESLIYGGRIRAGNLLGDPDLLRRQGNGYVAGDIKSGAGVEGATEDAEGRPKRHYAVQLALYTDILERLGVAAERLPFIWDVHGEEVIYNLDAPQGRRTLGTLWDFYQSHLETALAILSRKVRTLPALGSNCKLCHWRTVCTAELETLDDLTLIPELGRSRRDAMLPYVTRVREMAEADLDSLVQGDRSVIAGIGASSLMRFHARAKLQIQAEAKPYLTEEIHLPRADLELFFDIETDPMRDICYLHGFLERRYRDNNTERYVPFFVANPTPEEQERAFSEAWGYVRASMPCVIYYYSPYERTWWRKLQRACPNIATEEEVEEVFSDAIAVDLYQHVVRPRMEWPTRDYSIKTLATFLGFKWRDKHPSGPNPLSGIIDGWKAVIRKFAIAYLITTRTTALL